jgi:hypothetical protein
MDGREEQAVAIWRSATDDGVGQSDSVSSWPRRDGANLHLAVSHAWGATYPTRCPRGWSTTQNIRGPRRCSRARRTSSTRGRSASRGEACRHLLLLIGSPGDASLGTASLVRARPLSGPACDQAPSAMRPRLTPSMGIRIFLASARSTPVGRASTNVLFGASRRSPGLLASWLRIRFVTNCDRGDQGTTPRDQRPRLVGSKAS